MTDKRNFPETNACYVCQSFNIKKSKNKEQFTHFECNDCRAKWLDPRHFIVDGNLYSPEYYDGRVFHQSGGKFGYPESYSDLSSTHRSSYYEKYIDMIMGLPGVKGRRPLKVLDFGCGYGFFLKALVNRLNGQAEIHGIELDKDVCQKARNNLNTDRVYSVDLTGDAHTVPQNYFDVITMLDVLEHLHDPRSYLKKLASCANDTGYLLLSTTNIESFNARLYGDRWILHSPPYHTYYFGPRSIKAILEQSGWELRMLATERTIFHNEHAILETWRGRLARTLFQNDFWDRLTNDILHIGSIMVVVAQKK